MYLLRNLSANFELSYISKTYNLHLAAGQKCLFFHWVIYAEMTINSFNRC